MNLRSVGVLAFVAASALGLGFGLGITVVNPPQPESLQDAGEPTAVPVAQRSFSDSRTVTVQFARDGEHVLPMPSAGRVTAIAAIPGATIASGQEAIRIDGVPLMALYTEVPLWRDLAEGDKGEDVTALQTELQRLGHQVAVTGQVDRATRSAVAAILGGDTAADSVPESIPATEWVWLPSPEVTVAKVNAQVGQTVAENDPFLTLTGTASRAVITPIPQDALPGERVIDISGVTYPINDQGEISDPSALAELLSSSAYETAKAASEADTAIKLTAKWSLVTPQLVTPVPPAALSGAVNGTGCVSVAGQAVPVQVVSSELGNTLVTSETMLTSIDSRWPDGLTCPSS